MIQPAEIVSLLRYRIGLLMLFLPILFIWLHPYLEQAKPEIAEYRMLLGIISASMLLVSLFVLGGEFWDKLRSLFIYNMNVIQTKEPDATKPATVQTASLPPMSRLYMGGLFFVLSLLLPVFIPLLSHVPISDEIRLVIGGLMIFGIPQLFMLLAITILGKPGFSYLKQRLGGLLRGLLASHVSQARYRMGLMLLAFPLLLGITWPYLSMVFDTLHLYKYEIAIIGDVILILAVFILGGEFWEKLISLFRHRSRVANVPVS